MGLLSNHITALLCVKTEVLFICSIRGCHESELMTLQLLTKKIHEPMARCKHCFDKDALCVNFLKILEIVVFLRLQAFELATGDYLFEPHSGEDYSRDEGLWGKS